MTQEEAEKFVRKVMVQREPWESPDEQQVKWGAELILLYEQMLEEMNERN